MRFSYVARNDDTLGYLAGYKLQSTQRLNKITVHGAGTSDGLSALRNYRLRYEDETTQAANVISRLAGVKECVGSGSSVCLGETGFDWSDPTPLFKMSTAATLPLNTDDSWVPVDFTPADINGDGITDLVWTEAKRTQHRIRYALADKTNGALTRQDFTDSVSELEYEDNYENAILRVHTEVVDYNADGRMDIIVYSKMAGRTKVHLSKPQATGGWRLDDTGIDLRFTGRYRYADLDSDGLVDAYKLVARDGENTLVPTGYNLQVPTEYHLEVRYLKPASGQTVTSDRYYGFGTAVTLPLPFTQLPPDPPLREGGRRSTRCGNSMSRPTCPWRTWTGTVRRT